MIGRVVAGVLALALLAVGGDFAARWFVADQVASAAQRNLKLEEKPSVSIEGWPFLPMVNDKQFPAVRVSSKQMSVPMSGARFVVDDVTVRLSDVKLGAASTSIGHISGRATMPFSSLGAMTSGKASYVDPGRLAMEFSIPIAGKKSVVVVTSTPVLDEKTQRIVFQDPEVTVAGQPAPAELRSGLISSLAHPVRLSVGTIKVKTMTVTEAGLVAEVEAKGYKLPALR